MTKKEFLSISRKHELAAKNKMRKCFLPNCNEKAIASHLLQKNGILDRIAVDNHLYRFGIDPFLPQQFYFEKIGINKAFTFPGFCDYHDTSVFREIETNEIDFTDYRTNLLFTYRILADELRKKEMLIDWYTSNLNDLKLKLYLNRNYFAKLKKSILGYNQSIKDGAFFLNNFYSDMNTSTQNFSFITVELPYIEICASGVFTYETTAEINEIPAWLWDKPLTDIYFNLLPFENYSIAIFGCLTEMKEKCWEYVSSFNNADKKIVLKQISDLLLTRVENWLCSQSVFQQLKKCEAEITLITHESIESNDERRTLSFNLFDNLAE
jgi:hypothetical protein